MVMSDETDLRDAGFQVAKLGDYWVVSGSGLSLKYWPKTGTWGVFGCLYHASSEAIIEAVKTHKSRMPPDAYRSTCWWCGGIIWWVRSHERKRVALEADGFCHIPRCSGRNQSCVVASGETYSPIPLLTTDST
jgi:hypothetical protein